MATKDFRASQIETSKIIGTGSIPGTSVGIAIYSGSNTSNREGGIADSKVFDDVGTDVFLFVSGTISNSDNNRTDATLFGGDVVVSGTLYVERQVIEVDSVADGDFFVTGSMFVEPDSDSTKSVAFRKANGTDIFVVDSTNSQVEVTGRLGINETTPSAMLDVFGESAAGVPTLLVDHREDTVDAVDIIADSVTTANAFHISADGLTTGRALFVHDNSASVSVRESVEISQDNPNATNATALKVTSDSTGAVPGILVDRNHNSTIGADGVVGIQVDLDQTGEVASGQTTNVTGVDVQVNTNNNVGTVNAFGQKITMSGSTDGVHKVTGLSINVGSADDNTHLELLSASDTDDKFTISVGSSGDTQVETIDDGGSNANLVFSVDGRIDLGHTGSDGDNVASQGTNYLTIKPETNGSGLNATLAPSSATPGLLKIQNAVNDKDLATFRGDPGGNSVFIMSGGSGNSFDEATAGDVTFYVSGSVGKRGTFGTSVFGGDLVISGNLHGGSALKISDDIALTGSARFKEQSAPTAGPNEAVLYAKDVSGVTKLFTRQSDGLEVGPLGSGGALDDAYDTPIGGGTKATGVGAVITADGQPVQIKVAGASKVGLAVTGSVIFGSGSTGLNSSGLPAMPGTDTHFFVSGSKGGRGTFGTSVFGGDLVTSGTISKLDETGNASVTLDGPGVILSPGSTIEFGDPGENIFGDGTDLFISSSNNTNIISENRLILDVHDRIVCQKDNVEFFRVERSTSTPGDVTLSNETAGRDLILTTAATGDQVRIVSDDNKVVLHTYAELRGFRNIATGGTVAAINIDGKSGTPAIVTFFTASAPASTQDPVLNLDTNFFVSGAIGSRGTSTRGAAVFGGDLVVSGTMSVNRGQAGAGSAVTVTEEGKVGIGTDNPSYKLEVGGNASFGEFLYHRNNASGQNTYMRFENDKISFAAGNQVLLTLHETGQDIVTVGDGGDVDFQVRTNSDDNTLYVQGSSDRVGIGTNAPASLLHLKESAPTLSIQRESNGNSSTVAFLGAAGHTGAVMHMSNSNDLVFKTFDGVQPQEIMRLGGHYSSDVRQVILLSGSDMHASAMQPQEMPDINFFVSGAIGSRGTATRGTSVFGGDVAISGSLAKIDSFGSANIVLGESGVVLTPGTSIEFGDQGENIFGDGSNLFMSSSLNINVKATNFNLNGHLSASNGISIQYGGTEIDGISVGRNTSEVPVAINTSFGADIRYGQDISGLGTDVNLFVSGTAKSRSVANSQGTTLFAGDVAISGSLYKSVTTYAFFQPSTPTGNPTNEFHFEWGPSTVSSNDPELNSQNDFWMFFPKGGRILDVTARGGGNQDTNDDNPYTQRLVLAMYEWGDTWINSAEGASGNYTAIAHVTSSLPLDDMATEGSSRFHKAVYNMDNVYFRNNATGSFEIPAGSSISLAFKGTGTSGALSNTNFFVTVERDL